MSPLKISYRLQVEHQSIGHLNLSLDPHSAFLLGNIEQKPRWTLLDFHRCSNCPLDSESTHCPAALNLSLLTQAFPRLSSYSKIDVIAQVDDREFRTSTNAERALYSLLQVLLASSQCPHLHILRPLARFHRPFTSLKEMTFFLFSSSILRELRTSKTLSRDELFRWIEAQLDEIQIINKALSLRLQKASQVDATLNALVLFDLFIQSIPLILPDFIEEFYRLFEEAPSLSSH